MKKILLLIVIMGMWILIPITGWALVTAQSQDVRVFRNSVKSITLNVTADKGKYFTHRIIKKEEHGAIELLSPNPSGREFVISYKPIADYVGTDSFTFQVMSSAGETSNVATVSISVVIPASGEIDGSPILFTPLTPGNGAKVSEAHVLANTNIADNHYAFIDWDQKLVAWWRMDNDSSVGEDASHIYDWSGNGHGGQVIGAVAGNSPFSGAFQFNKFNSDYIELQNPLSFTSDDDITFSAWVNVHYTSAEKSIFKESHKTILYLKGSCEFIWRLHPHGPQQFSLIHDDTNEWSHYMASSARFEEWHHIAAVFNRKEQLLYFYFDGQLDGLRPHDISNLNHSFTATSMKISAGGFHGLIDELLIFKRALGPDEIKTLYDARINLTTGKYKESNGTYTYRAFAVDEKQHKFETEQRSVVLNRLRIIPSIALHYPLHQSWESNNSVIFRWTPTTVLNTNFTCSVIIDGAISKTFSEVERNEVFETVIPGIADGYHTCSVECSDGLLNKNASETHSFMVDSMNPKISVISPSSELWTINDDVSFIIDIDDINYAYGFIDWGNSLVGWWRAEDGARDDSGNELNGTMIGDTLTVENSKCGFGFRFDGDGDHIDLGDKPEFDFTQNDSFTLSAWVYKEGDGERIILSKSSNYCLRYRGFTPWEFMIYDGFNYYQAQFRDASPLNKWVHIAGVYDSNEKKLSLYIDGILRNTVVGDVKDFTTTTPLTIGTNWDGLIDEVMVFKRALHPEEIQSLYSATSENLITHMQNLEELHSYDYQIYAVNANGNQRASGMKTITVDIPDTPPRVVLDCPLNDTRSDSPQQTFKCTVFNTNRNTKLQSVTFHWDYSGSFVADETKRVTGDIVSVEFTKTNLVGKTFEWNCSATDTHGNTAFAPENFTYIVGRDEYYVATNGNDNNAGTMDKPFKTIQKAADIAKPGDTIYIRGGVYRETVIPPTSGNQFAPITFEGYPAEKAVISGADLITGQWSQHQGSIYKTTMDWDLGLGNNEIFVDGKAMMEARWPDADDVMLPNFLDIDSGTFIDKGIWGGSTASMNDSDLTQPAGFWDGAVVHAIWGARYHAITGEVTSSSPGTLELDLHSRPGWAINYGIYYITCSYNALDKEDEWFYDNTTSTLYLWAPNGINPTSYTVEAKKRAYAFDLKGKSYINIENLNIFSSAITIDIDSHHISIDNITAHYVSHYTLIDESSMGVGGKGTRDTGIILDGHDNTIKNSEIAYSAGNGVSLIGNNNTVHNCKIHDVNYVVTECAAVQTGGRKTQNNKIIHNKLYNAGRGIITHCNAQNLKILHNEMFNNRYGGEPWDLGATYAIATDGKESEIAYNYIHDIKSIGIYLDWSCHNFNVHHNVVWDVIAKYPIGLHCNTPSTGNELYNNTIFGAWLSVNSGFEPVTADNTIVRNNICKTLSGSWPAGATLDHNLQINYTDPLFIDQDNHNFRLQAGSPAIDAGVDVGFTKDIDGKPIIGAPDIGAYEYFYIKGDVNNDEKVNIQDVQLCINVILGTEINPDIVIRADINNDGDIDKSDVKEISNIILKK